MQSPLFAYTEQQSQDRYTVQNPQLLRVALTGARRRARPQEDAMVAYQGLVDFDGEYQTGSQRTARARTGEGLDLMRCSGQGTVYFANLAQYVHVVDVDQDGLTVDTRVRAGARLGPAHRGHRRGQPVRHLRLRQVPAEHLRRGKVALMTSGGP